MGRGSKHACECHTVCLDPFVGGGLTIAEAAEDRALLGIDEHMVGAQVAVGEAALVQIGDRGGEGGESGGRRWCGSPRVGPDKGRLENGRGAFGEVDESDNTGVVALGQEFGLVVESCSGLGFSRLFDGDERIAAPTDGDATHGRGLVRVGRGVLIERKIHEMQWKATSGCGWVAPER